VNEWAVAQVKLATIVPSISLSRVIGQLIISEQPTQVMDYRMAVVTNLFTGL